MDDASGLFPGLPAAAGTLKLCYDGWLLRCPSALSTLSAFDYRRRSK